VSTLVPFRPAEGSDCTIPVEIEEDGVGVVPVMDQELGRSVTLRMRLPSPRVVAQNGRKASNGERRATVHEGENGQS
jgi:hypothetical protein